MCRLAQRIRPVFILPVVFAALGCRENMEPPTASEPALEVAPAQALAFRHVTAGDAHGCGLTVEKAAYCWGSNNLGELGIGTVGESETLPVAVVGGLAFRQLSAGCNHTCGVTPNNRLFCWGSNHLGQLGIGTATGPELCFGQSCSTRPIRIARGLSFRQVSAGSLHTCAVTTEDVAYCWGRSRPERCGNGTRLGSDSPVRVAGGLAFREVSAGNQFTCGVTTDDVAYCWGINTEGALGLGEHTGPESCFTGDGDSPCAMTPRRVARGLDFRAVSAGSRHACGVTKEGVAFCWGANAVGQLGGGNSDGPELCTPISPCSTRPARVVGGLAFLSVTAGPGHTCGVTTDHAAYCWGL